MVDLEDIHSITSLRDPFTNMVDTATKILDNQISHV